MPRGTAATPGGTGYASIISGSSVVLRAYALSSVCCRAKAHGSTPLNRNGSMGNEPSRNQIACSVLLNSKHGFMPTIVVSVKSIWSCQKRSLDYALGQAHPALTVLHPPCCATLWPRPPCRMRPFCEKSGCIQDQDGPRLAQGLHQR